MISTHDYCYVGSLTIVNRVTYGYLQQSSTTLHYFVADLQTEIREKESTSESEMNYNDRE